MNLSLPGEANIIFKDTVRPSIKLSVIIPAKDESAYIAQTLEALRKQFDVVRNPINHSLYEVLVLANNCSDDTFEICKNYQRKYPEFNLYVANIVLEKEQAHIGTARRILMDAAHDRLCSVAGAKGIIVSTDADSEVSPHWIYYILKEVENGADVVGGRILPRDTPKISRKHHLRDVGYRFLKSRLEAELDPCIANPWPRHFQCFGPSLAVTCELYERAGRLPVLPFLEDEEFRKALNRVDAKIRHSPDVQISTSGRLDGRVKFGFSVQLQHWSEMSLRGESQKVESLNTLIFKFEFKNRLRRIWNRGAHNLAASKDLKILAEWAEISSGKLLNVCSTSIYFESLWEKIELLLHQDNHRLIDFQPVDSVIQSLRIYFHPRPKVNIKRLDDLADTSEALAG